MNRVLITGRIINEYEQTIELSDEELQQLRNDLDEAKDKGEQAIDDFLGEQYGDTGPIDCECDDWSATLIDNEDKEIERLDIDKGW